MKRQKLYNIQTTRCGLANTDRLLETGPRTLDELKKYFSYTLEIGHSWNKKIKQAHEIKTIKQFMTALQKSFDEKEGACYTRTSVTLIEC